MKCEEKSPSETCSSGLPVTEVKFSKKIVDLIPVMRFRILKKSELLFRLRGNGLSKSIF